MKLREKVLGLDSSIIEEPKKYCVAYKLNTNFVDIVIQNKQLSIVVNVPTCKLDDPHHIARDLETPKHIGKWGNGDYDMKIDNLFQIGNVFDLITKSYAYNK